MTRYVAGGQIFTHAPYFLAELRETTYLQAIAKIIPYIICVVVTAFEGIGKVCCEIFLWKFVMKKLLLWCLLIGAIGCATDEQLSQSSSHSVSSPELSDKKFIELFADALELHRRYVHAPDSLLAGRKKLFKRHGITRVDVEKFLEDRRDHPEKWDAFIALIQQRFGETGEREMKAFQKAGKKGEM